METNRVINFINFLFGDTEENNKIIEEELKEAGLDTEKFQQKMLKIIELEEAENHLEEKLEA
ncbi:MAG: hypothetical protein H6609_17405 [Ignavibacteriales bacterium]|nr:hypothetical protein [Ignavibacteriales bacterium]